MFIKLAKKKDFERVAKFGQPFFVKELGFKIIKNNKGRNRYGIVVSLKIDKRAVVRNKIRRRLREIIRKFEKENFPPKAPVRSPSRLAEADRDQPQAEKQGFDVMILVRESVKDLKYKQTEEKLLGLFRRADLFTLSQGVKRRGIPWIKNNK